MTRQYIVVSFKDDAIFPNNSIKLFTDINSAFNEVNSLKQFHEENDSLYELNMSFFNDRESAVQFIIDSVNK
jgi:hypothetical protein